MAKTGANALCRCGSGFKYKKCCRDRDLGVWPMRLPGKPDVLITNLRVRAAVQEKEAVPLASWYVRLARQLTARAVAEDANEAHVLMALLMVVTAGEAVVNRLLEPLVPEDEWTEVERATTPDKWVSLSQRAGVQPIFAKGRAPLQPFLAVVAVRNDLVHFKHGANLYVSEQPVQTRYDRGVVTVGGAAGPMAEHKPKRDVRQALQPERALGYLQALGDVLDAVLAVYTDDEFGVVQDLRAALTGPL